MVYLQPYTVDHVANHVQSPFLRSPRPISYQQLPDAEHLMEMAEMENKPAYLGDIKYCNLEPVSPRPVVLPLIPDAERLQLIAENDNENSPPSSPSNAGSYSPPLGAGSFYDSFAPAEWMDGCNDGRHVHYVDARFSNYDSSAAIPHHPLNLLNNTPLLLEETALPWNSTLNTGAYYQSYHLGFEKLEACHPSPPHKASRFHPFEESDRETDKDDEVLCYFLPTSLKVALDTASYS